LDNKMLGSQEGVYCIELVKFRDETFGQSWHPCNVFILYALYEEGKRINKFFYTQYPWHCLSWWWTRGGSRWCRNQSGWGVFSWQWTKIPCA